MKLFSLFTLRNEPQQHDYFSKYKLIMFGLSFLLFMVPIVSAGTPAMQQIEITGTVTDAAGTLPGVSVILKGTTTGTVTDIDGKFSIKVPNTDAVLQFSFIGYVSQDVMVGSLRKIEIEMTEDVQTIGEVVITGYGGTQQRSKLTNSIASVKEETFGIGMYSNPAQALSGAVSGLKVMQSSGNPGAAPTVTLRGGTNLDGTGSPLVMVDGQVRGGLNDINPDDIESMEVLKDAGATALYGARASNGVILVTTKKGKNGRSEVNVKGQVGLNYLNNPYQYMGARDYLYWMRNAYKNSSQIYQDQDGNWKGATTMATLTAVAPHGTGNLYWDPANPTVPLDGNKDPRAVWSPMIMDESNKFLLNEGWQSMKDPIYGDDILFTEFDYAKAAFQTPSITQDYTISFSGGNRKGHYYASIGYYDAEGLPIETYYNRITAVFNGDYKIKSWLTSFTTFNYARSKWKNVTNTGEGNYFARMLSAPPSMRGYNANGETLLGTNSGDGNPQVNIDAFTQNNNTDKFTLGQSFKIDLMKGLSLNASTSLMYSEGFNEAFTKDYLRAPGNWVRTRSSSASFSRTMDQTYLATANYKSKIAEVHHLSALAGVEYFDSYYTGFNASGSDAPTDDFADLGLTSPDANKRNIDSWHSRQRILSFMGSVSYDYMDKYLLSVTFREDGYSLLLDNRWGAFPGVSAGWVLSKEQFMYNLSHIISFAKLRSSYGVNGNVSGLGNYELQGSYGTSKYNGNVGYRLTDIPNPTIRWERSNTFEIGVDLGFLHNLISLNTTFYNRITEDKFAYIPLPGSSGITSMRSNNGTLRNRGVEIELGVKLLRQTTDWKWDINTNISYNKNTIVKLPDNGLERNRQNAYQVYDSGSKQLVWVGGYQEGHSPGAIYAHVAQGIFKTDAEINEVAANRIDITTGNNGSNGRTLYGPNEWAKLSDSEKATGYPIQPGDVNWKDVNGDGTIDNFDKEYMGSYIPKWFGGLTNTLSWKGISLFVRLDYALGHYQNDMIRPWFMGAMQGTFNSLADTHDTWTPDNINAAYPKYYWADQLGKRNYARPSSMFVYQASYLCLREIALSYKLPSTLVKKAGLEDVRLSVTGQNLGYLSNSKLYSPEIGGDVGGGYALPKTIIFGASLTF